MIALAEYIFAGLIVGFIYTYNSHTAREYKDNIMTGCIFVCSLIFWPVFLLLLLMRFIGSLFNDYIFK